MAGFIGVFVSLKLQVALDHNNNSSDSEMGLIAGLVGLIAAGASLVVIPLAYGAFQRLLCIANYWLRVLATAAVVTGFFLLIVFIAGKSVVNEDFSLTGIVLLGGWAYWLAALGAAALVYKQGLFRTDNSGDDIAEPTA
ncbi:hypothetical protein GCM10022409_07060 [Hymenobacter glaciei]|uniref:Uncharacterized protein n=1 Tax=Hymenobacter glaciei TaxID=877209 RepID=A0ABP7TFS9_9BACT